MAGYWEANWQNFKNALTPGDKTPNLPVPNVSPVAALRELAPPSESFPEPPTVSVGLRSSAATTPAAQPEQPAPVALSPTKVKTAPTATTPIPVGRYGWKGTSESMGGNPTLVYGTPGQDGSGIGSWVPGSARPGGLRVAGPAAATARFTPQVQAPAFDQPVKSPLDISIENLNKINAPLKDTSGQPQYLGPESGLGWKTRLGLYKEQMDAYNAGLNRENALAVAGLNRSTAMDAAGLRALVDREQIAAGAGLRDAQALEAASKAAAGLRLSNAAAALQTAKPGTPEYGAALRDYLVLSGQGAAAVKDPKQNIEKIDQKDQFGTTISQKLVRVNPDGTFSELKDATPGAGVDAAFDAMIAADPKLSAKFNALPPEQQAAQRKLYRDSQIKGM